MLSNDVAGRAPGQGCRAALLNVKGAVQALLRVLVEKDVIVLETDLDRVGPVQQVLEHHRVAAPVRFAARPTSVLALSDRGPRGCCARSGSTPRPRAPRLTRPPRSRPPAAPRAGGGPARRRLRPARGPRDVDGRLGGPARGGRRPVGHDALDALRVEALRPWYGSDVTDENLLHETGLVAECHSPAKGCYVGQEVVARLEARGGHVNKALRGLRLSAPAAAGAAVSAEGREIGRVTTAAVSPRLGPIALAYVHREHFAPGTAVQVDGAPATVVTSFEEPSEKEAAEPARE